uniref:Laminin N-terminal domain-containing protein n=1 Tax=Gopherus agassizii TaxID=38772 RepID=A0A452J216_9SAUR
ARYGLQAAPAAGMRRRALPLLLLLELAGRCVAAMDECADEASGRPQRCMPEFVNAAFNVTVVATNTCGSPAEEYCVQTGVTGVTKSCHLCDAAQPHLQHGAAFLTDYNQADTTWWQSQTMLAGVQYPSAINLTLHLGKSAGLLAPPVPALGHSPSRRGAEGLSWRDRYPPPLLPLRNSGDTCMPNRNFIRMPSPIIPFCLHCIGVPVLDDLYLSLWNLH